MRPGRTTRTATWNRSGIVLAALLLAGCTASGSRATTGQSADGSDPAAAVAPDPGPADAGVTGIVREVEPSVVTVLRPDGQGSGVVYDEDGLVITNFHVIDGARELEVQFADASREPAEVVAAAPEFDLAVLRVDREDLPAAAFASTLPSVGMQAVAIGSPLGFENTVTAGIVSGLQRSIPSSQTNPNPLVDLIQTDAPISPGNSGGALVGPEGEVVGINVAYLPPGQTGAVAIGFAIPSPTVLDVVEQLLETGEARDAYLGVQPVALTAQIVEQFGLAADRGVLVRGVADRSPAADAGIIRGDVLIEVDGEPVDTVPDLQGALRRAGPDATVELTVISDGEERTVDTRLSDRPDQLVPSGAQG